MNPVKKIGLAMVALLFVLGGCQQPDFIDTAGNGHRYDDMRGKWVILNYWATWCGPCIKEIPELNEIAHNHSDKVLVFGVNFDAPEGEERQMQVAKMKIEFPVYIDDPAEFLGITTPQVLPTTFVFNPDLELHKTLTGPQTLASLMAALE